MTIEQAVLQGRLDNFENFKNNYIAAINEMIAALEALANAQREAEFYQQMYQEQAAEAAAKAESDKRDAATAKWNTSVQGKIAAANEKGKDVWFATGDDGKLHYSTISKKNVEKLAGGNSATKIPGTKTSSGGSTGLKSSGLSSSKSSGSSKKNNSSSKKKKKASGSHSLPSSALYHINELGDELLIPPTGNLAYLTKGTGVIPAHLTDNLMDLGRYNMSQWAKVIGNASAGNTTDSHDIIIQNMTVKSDNANDFVRQLQNLSILKK